MVNMQRFDLKICHLSNCLWIMPKKFEQTEMLAASYKVQKTYLKIHFLLVHQGRKETQFP